MSKEDSGFQPVSSDPFTSTGSATARDSIDLGYVADFVKGSTQAASTGYEQGYTYGLNSKGSFTQPPPAVSTGFIDQNESRAFGEGYAHGFSGGFAAGYAQGLAKAGEQGGNGDCPQSQGFNAQGFKPAASNDV